jgi:hypothetical protein
LAIAVLVLFIKGETALVHVARLESGRGPVEDTVAVASPQASGLARLRRMAGRLPFYRAFVAIEFTFLALVAGVVDVIAGELDGSKGLLIALVPVAVITAVGHLLAILTSSRLR